MLAAAAIFPACEDEDIAAIEEALRMSDFPSQAALAGNPTQGEFKEAISSFLGATRQLPGARANTEPLTIAGGAITPTKGFHTVNTEGSAAADDLEIIDPANLPDGSFLYLLQAIDSRIVTIKHGAGGFGEILLPGDADITLTDAFDGVILRRRAHQWVFVSRLSNISNVVTPHGFRLYKSPGSYTWSVPAGVSAVYISAIGGGGGGGGGGDSAIGNGADGEDGENTIFGFQTPKISIYAVCGRGGGGGKQNGSNPSVHYAAQLPVGKQGGRFPEPAGIHGGDPVTPLGTGGLGGTGVGTATGGAGGSYGLGFHFYEHPTYTGEIISIKVGAGGKGGAGAGAGLFGSDGWPGAVLIQY